MIESGPWKFAVEVHPEGWSFPATATWIAGWISAPQERTVSDLRGWIDGRPALAIWGIPKPGLDEQFINRPGPPYTGFTLLVTPHRGASLFRLEVLDQSGRWTEIFRQSITTSSDAPVAPEPRRLAEDLPALAMELLRLKQRRQDVSWHELADQTISSLLAEPLDSLPNPPFHGALEEPRHEGWIRYGRLSITGWLAHRTAKIRHITAVVDPLLENTLLYGLKRSDVNDIFGDLPGREKSAFVGHVDLPADTQTPCLLKIFAELEDGTKHLVFAQRFTPKVIAGEAPPLPTLSRTTFARAAWALKGAARRHGLVDESWLALSRPLRRAWTAFATEAPAAAAAVPRSLTADAPLLDAAPLRVAFVTHNLNFEGAPWFIFELARHFAAQPGVTVTVLSPQAGPMQRTYAEIGLDVRMVDATAIFNATTTSEAETALDSLARDLPWTEHDLVIANTMVSFWAVLAAQRARKPALLYVHESSPVHRFFAPILNPSVHPFVEQAFQAAAKVVFTAKSTRTVHHALEHRGNFALLPSWIDVGRIDRFAAAHDTVALRLKHGLDPEAILLVNIGSVCERKGQHVFIQAADLLREELRFTYPDRKIQFVMVGARPGLYLQSLEEEIERRGLNGTALFLPETGDIFDFYHLADIFVCTSFEESFPRVLLESAAFHRPIVSSNVNGIAEMLAPNEAWLVPPGDRYQLAKAIKEALAALFADDDDRIQRARAKIESRYHESRSLPRHLNLARYAARRA